MDYRLPMLLCCNACPGLAVQPIPVVFGQVNRLQNIVSEMLQESGLVVGTVNLTMFAVVVHLLELAVGYQLSPGTVTESPVKWGSGSLDISKRFLHSWFGEMTGSGSVDGFYKVTAGYSQGYSACSLHSFKLGS